MSNEDGFGLLPRLAEETHGGGIRTGAELDTGRFGSVMEVLPDAVVVTDSDGRITLVNRQTETLFGYARTELLGQPIERLIPEQMRAAHQRHRATYATKPSTRPMGAHLHVRLFGRHRNGSVFPAEISLSPLTGEDGTHAVISIIRDISERKQLEQARAEAETATEELRRVQAITDVALTYRTLNELLHALLERICDVMRVDNATILLMDADAQVLTVRATRGLEEAVAAYTRVPVGAGFAGRIAASRQPQVVDDVSAFPMANPFLREKLRSVAGVPLLVENKLVGVVHIGSATPRRFEEREVRLLQLVTERIALAIDHARLYEAEQVSEARFQRLMESSVIGLAIIEGEMVIEANDAFLQLVGYSHEDLVAGRLQWPALTPAEYLDASRSAVEEAVATGSSSPFEKEYLRQDGRRVPVLVGSVLLDRGSVRLVTFVVDLTERKRLEREREEAQARELAVQEVNRHMDQFFATAAHDIRNPVTIVKGNVQLARRRLDKLVAGAIRGPEDLDKLLGSFREGLVDAEESVERLSRLVARLFDVARARSGTIDLQQTPCDLVALVEEQVAAQRVAAPDRVIRLELPDASGSRQPVPVVADADRLAQVLANYITNALKYSTDDQPIEVRLEVSEGLAVVSVRDGGPGLPLEEQVRVWEPFHRAPGVEVRSRLEGASGSLGLGLHICKRIIELHSGRVGVESVVGQGSTFWFTLPLASDSEAGVASSS